MAHCVHHVPGRARFKVPQLRSDPRLAIEIEEQVVALDGIRHVEINRHASSVIVHYDSEARPFETIVQQIRANTPAISAGTNGVGMMPLNHDATSRNGANGTMARTAGQIFGQAMFATLVQRALERSLLSILTGVR